MKKVLLVSSDNDTGSGAFRSMAELCRLLNDSGEYLPVVLIPKRGNGVELLDKFNVRWIYVRSFTWVIRPDECGKAVTFLKFHLKRFLNQIAIMRIRRIIRKENIALVHNNTIWTYAAAIAALKEKVPLVWHIRESLDADQNRCLYSSKCYSLVNKADRIIFISRFLYEHYKDRVGKDNIAVIYNGVNPGQYFYKRELFQDDKVRFLNVGNMTANKGQEYIIEACAKLLESGETRFLIDFVGEGKKEEQLKKLAKERGCEEHVCFRGFTLNVGDYYKVADVFIMSSDAEAFGRTTVEAMMSGCLVIGMNAGATPEILEDGKNGMIFNVRDHEALSVIMRDIINDPELCRKKADEGQKAAMEKYSSASNMNEIVRVYKELSIG